MEEDMDGEGTGDHVPQQRDHEVPHHGDLAPQQGGHSPQNEEHVLHDLSPPDEDHGPQDGDHGPQDGNHASQDGEHSPQDEEHGPQDEEHVPNDGSSEESGGGGGNRMWQIFVVGLEGKTTTINIHKDATVDELIRKISRRNGIPPDAQRVLYTTKQLEYGHGYRLSHYNIQNQSVLFVVLRLQGGSNADASLNTPEEAEENTDFDAPSMTSGEGDPDTTPLRMSCGHTITKDKLYTYCRDALRAGKYIFQCPHISKTTREHCGKEWTFREVRRHAGLTLKQRQDCEFAISENYLFEGMPSMGIQRCPSCQSYCERISKYGKRVVCSNCSIHFCWYCLREFDGRGADDCGNRDCRSEDKRLRILRKCKQRSIVGVANCPSIRACVACGILIKYDKACKHMTCMCGQKFCFICLEPAVRGKYQCGTFHSRCEVAAVQKTIPSMEGTVQARARAGRPSTGEARGTGRARAGRSTTGKARVPGQARAGRPTRREEIGTGQAMAGQSTRRDESGWSTTGEESGTAPSVEMIDGVLIEAWERDGETGQVKT